MKRKKQRLRIYTILKYTSIGVFLLGILWFINLLWYKPFFLQLFYERVFWNYGSTHPEFLSKIRYYENYGFNAHNGRLNDISDSYTQGKFQQIIRNFEILNSYPLRNQTQEEQLSSEILDYHLQNRILSQQFRYHNYTIDHISGIQIDFVLLMLNYHPIHTVEDAENYLKRLSLISKKIDHLIESILIREEYSAVPPGPILNKCVIQIQHFSRGENVLYNDFKKKLLQLRNISREARGEYLYEVRKEIEDNLIPAFLRLAKELKKVEEADESRVGIWKLPDGEHFYAFLLETNFIIDQNFANTITDDLLSLAYKEINLAKLKMKKLSKKLRTNNFSMSLLSRYFNNKKIFYENSSHGKSAYLSDIQSILVHYKSRCVSYFDIKNMDNTILVRPMLSLQEHFFPKYMYYSGSLKGDIPAVLYVNCRDMSQHPKYSLHTAIVRYVFPGMHFQLRIQQKNNHLPTFRRAFSSDSFKMGWQLYVLRLACEESIFYNPYSILHAYYLHILQAYQSIIDVKIHNERWSREQAVSFLVEETGLNTSNAEILTDKCIVDPGKAPTALVGYIQIMNLREEAQNALGEKFVLKEFHRAILKNGAIPLLFLDQIIKAYIQENH